MTTVNFTVIFLYGLDVFVLNNTRKSAGNEDDDYPERSSQADPEICVIGVDNPIRDSSLYMRPKVNFPQVFLENLQRIISCIIVRMFYTLLSFI